MPGFYLSHLLHYIKLLAIVFRPDVFGVLVSKQFYRKHQAAERHWQQQHTCSNIVPPCQREMRRYIPNIVDAHRNEYEDHRAHAGVIKAFHLSRTDP